MRVGSEKGLKVLVVDDEDAILASTGSLLKVLGLDVVTTRDAGEVLGLLHATRPDVLLQDVRMPGLDLHALVRSVRALPEDVRAPIVLFSAGMNLDEVCEDVGADGAVEKPFRPAELLRALREAAAGRPMPA